MAAGVASHPDTANATHQACLSCQQTLAGSAVDLAFVFFSPHHVPHARTVADVTLRTLNPRHLIGVSGQAVLGQRMELEKDPGVSILACSLPGVTIDPFTHDHLLTNLHQARDDQDLADRLSLDEQSKATLLLVDPFSVPTLGMLGPLSSAHTLAGAGPVIGGVASAANTPNGNALIINDKIHTTGLVGVRLVGPIRVDTIVSQGARPIGPNFIVTSARNNLVLGLGGISALQAIQSVIDKLSDDEQSRIAHGLLLGIVADEYKERFGRNDYLMRNVAGVDRKNHALAIQGLVRVGQTVRLHLRDRQTAHEDLAMLIDGQRVKDPPAGSLLFTCNGRGANLFGSPHHDSVALATLFKDASPDQPPIAGFFASGEIGPVAGQSHVHGLSACAALFRQPTT